MKANFPRSLRAVLVHEGGYVNHPKDPGGATNKGVTQSTYNAYRHAKGREPQSVRSISDDEVGDIYKSRYWDVVKGDELPSGLDYAVFDFAVNSGPSRSAKFLQRIVGSDDDGQIGPATLKAVSAYPVDTAIKRLCDRRLAWLKTLATYATFGKGWSNRVANVRADALEIAGAAPPVLTPVTKPKPAPNIDEDTLAPVGHEEAPKPASGGKAATGAGAGAVAAAAAVKEGHPILAGFIFFVILLGLAAFYLHRKGKLKPLVDKVKGLIK